MSSADVVHLGWVQAGNSDCYFQNHWMTVAWHVQPGHFAACRVHLKFYRERSVGWCHFEMLWTTPLRDLGPVQNPHPKLHFRSHPVPTGHCPEEIQGRNSLATGRLTSS
eukprot:762861_1